MNGRVRGITLIEMLVACLIMLLLGSGLFTLMTTGYGAQASITDQNTVDTRSRFVINTLADNLRGTTNLTAAGPSDVTFTDESDNSVRYWLSNGSLLSTTNGQPSSGNTLMDNVSSLSFTYWTYSNGSWSSSNSPSAPANVGAVDFTVVVTLNGYSRQLSGTVVIRDKE
ncbi:MAG: prepilin-type N-terminal cleavage/methylation domain-containing protein [Armatimonadetes bacterium]|nr:prepilin-type N-terminal cleavage/methylation domain-containing protein [Armatimonadota bacterium]